MSKARTFFACSECGHENPRWLGKCPACGAWESLVETREESSAGAAGRLRAGRGGETDGEPVEADGAGPVPIDAVSLAEAPRLATGLDEVDRVLGGGVVPGASVLIGGEPGVGKSTLLLQVAHAVAAAGRDALYVTGEESLQQVRLRAERLRALAPRLRLFGETRAERVAEAILRDRPAIVVIDSVQTLRVERLAQAAATTVQVRESGQEMCSAARRAGSALFLLGHVTKEGAIAGPRVLEHMVDAVLYLEGERGGALRVLRSHKNRFGCVSELGVFEMGERGLVAVTSPSEAFLAGRAPDVPGSAVACALEGSRAVLVEVQALTTACAFGTPQRRVKGLDPARVALILAVLERRAGLAFGSEDVFVKAISGARLREPAGDLAIALACAASLRDRALPERLACFGEVGLGGEVRAVGAVGARVREAARLGFEAIVAPERGRPEEPLPSGVEVIPVASLGRALDVALGGPRR